MVLVYALDSSDPSHLLRFFCLGNVVRKARRFEDITDDESSAQQGLVLDLLPLSMAPKDCEQAFW